MAVLARTRAAPTSGLPQDIDVILPASEASSRTQFPTHMLAVHAKQPKLQTNTRTGAAQLKRKVTLFPAHDLVLVAHCANLPTLPPSGSQLLSTQPPQDTSLQLALDDAGEPEPASPISLKLPVVPLCLPSPPTFPVLQSYLYTKRGDALLARLLPQVPGTTPAASGDRPAITSDRVETMRNLVEALSDAYPPSMLLKHALTTHGLWSNVCVLGVHDDKLWRVLDLAWEVLMGAMDAATRKHPEHSVYGPALTPLSTPPTTPPRAAPAAGSSSPDSTPTTPTSGSNDSMSDGMSSASSQTSPSSAAASDKPEPGSGSDMDTTVSEADSEAHMQTAC